MPDKARRQPLTSRSGDPKPERCARFNAVFQGASLEYVAGPDGPDRPATGAAIPRLQLPYRVDGQQPEIRIAVAKTPWSWARINALGGMHPEDFRRQQQEAPLPTSAENNGADDRRKARTQPLDLSGYTTSFEGGSAAAECARMESIDSAQGRGNVHFPSMNYRSAAGTVYLHDPIEVAGRLAGEVEQAISEFEGLQHEITAHKYYDSAIVAVSTFFNPALHKQTRTRRRGRSAGSYSDPYIEEYVDRSKAAKHLRDCAEDIDERYLRETILRRSERRELRTTIRERIAHLAAYLDGKACGSDNKLQGTLTDNRPDTVRFPDAIRDYAYLPEADYLKLWERMLVFASRLNFDPLDQDIDTPDAANERDQMRPGRWYLDQLIKPDGELHPVLFPAADQIDMTCSAYEPPEIDPEERIADGLFVAARYARAATKTERQAAVATSAGKSGLITANGVASAWVSVLRKQLEPGEPNAVSNRENAFRLIKGLALPEVESLRIVPAGESLADARALDAAWLFPGQEAAGSQPAPAGWRLVDPAESLNPALLRPSVTREDVQRLFADANAETPRARFPTVVVDYGTQAADSVERAERVTDADPEAARRLKHIETARMGLAPAVAVLAAFNLHEAASVADERNTSLSEWDQRVAAAAFLAAAMDAAIAIGGEDLPETLGRAAGQRIGGARAAEQVGKAMRRGFNKGYNAPFAKNRVTIPTGAAAVVSAAMGIVSIVHAYDSFDEGEDDLGLAYTAQGAAFLGVAWTTLNASATGLMFALGGPWGVAFILLSIAAGIWVAWVSDTDLERWARHGPFGPADERLIEEFADLADKPQELHERLMQALLRPKLQLIDHADGAQPMIDGQHIDFEARCVMPAFAPGESGVVLHVTRQATRPGPGGLPPQERIDRVAQEPLKDETGRVIGIRYGYQHDAGAVPITGSMRYRARLRYYTAEGHALPGELDNPGSSGGGFEIDTDQPGWMYDDLRLGRR